MLKQESARVAGDATSISLLIGTLVDILPAAAAALTIIWTGIRIYETETVKNLIKRFRE